MTDPEAIKADIEQARAELAQTADALAAKLDVKAQAERKAQEARSRAAEAYESAKASAPVPVQKAVAKVEQVGRPVAAKAAEDKGRTALIVLGVLAAALITRRLTRRADVDVETARPSRHSTSGLGSAKLRQWPAKRTLSPPPPRRLTRR